MNTKNILMSTLLALALALLAGCQAQESTIPAAETAAPLAETAQPEQESQPDMANPASENCIAQGGTLAIEEPPDGGQFGVCYFEDNRQCEEWALLRGDCPAGGVKVTGYITPAARYCAITGGTYAVTGAGGADDEQGTCTFNDGSLCDAWDYYNGQCAPGASPPPAAEAQIPAEIPLKDALANLEPQDVFQNFYDITQVPRPSGHTDQIRQFLVNFGQQLGLETIVDEAGNVIIRKPAAAGLENRQGVVLQAHMDMVPDKDDDLTFDFVTDPIQAIVSGDNLVAEGTTLGADDGIGMAMIMAVLQDETLQTGPLEGLFTVDEETDMSGANGLKENVLQGSILINLDSEWDGVFIIGAAGGGHVDITSTYSQVPALADSVAYQVEVQGLKGGHSGVDINLGRGHAIKLLVRLLKGAVEPYGLRLANFNGGSAGNAIPRAATAVVVLPDDQAEAFAEYVQEFEATVKSELSASEPDLSVELVAVQPPDQVMDETFQANLIDAIYATPQGVMRMSDALPDLVETSTNLGLVNVQDGQMDVVCVPRSSVDSALDDVSQMIASVWELAGAKVAFNDYYPGWNPDPESPILGLMETTYRDLNGQEPEVIAVHAGLECGVIGAKYPTMDMISIGPTLNDVHSPAERLLIPSVGNVMNLLLEVLQNIPEA